MRIFVCLIAFCVFLWGGVDSYGRLVEIKDAKRIVFIGEGALRAGVYLGLEDKIVAIQKIDIATNAPYSEFIKSSQSLKNAKLLEYDGYFINKDEFGELKADLLVVANADKDRLDRFERLLNIPVLGVKFDYKNPIKSFKDAIWIIANATNSQDRANEFLENVSSLEFELSSYKISGKKFYIGGLEYFGSRGILASSENYAPFELLGIKNEADFTHALNQISFSAGTLLRIDPDIIFIDENAKQSYKKDLDESERILNLLSAIKEKQVYFVPNYINYGVNIENCFIGAYEIAYHTGINLDLQAKKKQIYKIFYGKDFK